MVWIIYDVSQEKIFHANKLPKTTQKIRKIHWEYLGITEKSWKIRPMHNRPVRRVLQVDDPGVRGPGASENGIRTEFPNDNLTWDILTRTFWPRTLSNPDIFSKTKNSRHIFQKIGQKIQDKKFRQKIQDKKLKRHKIQDKKYKDIFSKTNPPKTKNSKTYFPRQLIQDKFSKKWDKKFKTKNSDKKVKIKN